MRQRIGITTAILLLAFAGSALVLASDADQKPQTFKDFFGKPEYESVDTTKPLKAQTRTVEVAGRTFEIPKIFIGSTLDEGLVQNGLILEYVLPNFTSKLDFADRDAYKQAFKAGQFGHMLIENADPRPSFDIVVSNRRRNLTKEEYVDRTEGLDHYKWYHGKPEAPKYWSDTYLEKDESGKVISFVECSLAARVPHCSHMFFDKSLRYNVTYNAKNYFTAWKEQRRKAIAFVDSFEIKPNSNNHQGR